MQCQDDENFCSELYDEAAKCEAPHGFYASSGVMAQNHGNQKRQEASVCDFIKLVKNDIYKEQGQILIVGTSLSFEATWTVVTGGQKWALLVLSGALVIMVWHICKLQARVVAENNNRMSSLDAASNNGNTKGYKMVELSDLSLTTTTTTCADDEEETET